MVNDEEKAKKCRNAEYNEDKKNDDKKDSTEVNDESENGKNATKEVHTDESDEKTENTTINDAKIDENETKINTMDKNTKAKMEQLWPLLCTAGAGHATVELCLPVQGARHAGGQLHGLAQEHRGQRP